jgi:site-specific DNA recombinase
LRFYAAISKGIAGEGEGVLGRYSDRLGALSFALDAPGCAAIQSLAGCQSVSTAHKENAAVKRAIGYVRQSDERQRDNYSGESQEAAIRQYIAARGWPCLGVEHEIQSGLDSLDARPVFRSLRERGRRGDFDVLVIYIVSRATRAGGIHTLLLANECEEAGIELHFVNDGGRVDVSNIVGQITLLLKGDQAREERAHLVEAMHRGSRTRVTEHGYPIHGTRARYGYRFVDVLDDKGKVRKKGRCEVVEEQASVIRRMFDLYLSGMGTQAIADLFSREGVPPAAGGKWYHTTVRTYLEDTRYIGIGYAFTYRHIRLGYRQYKQTKTPQAERVELRDVWPPIVDTQVFYRVQERLRTAKERAVRNNMHPERFLLRGGFIKCGVCERSMTCYNHARMGAYYRCMSSPWNEDCPHPNIMAHKIDDFVRAAVQQLASRADEVERWLESRQRDERADLAKEIARAEKLRDQVKGREHIYIQSLGIAADEVQRGEMEAQLARLAEQRQSCENELARLRSVTEAQAEARAEIEDITAFLESIRDAADGASYDRWRQYLGLLGVKVKVWPKGTKPRYRLWLDVPPRFLPVSDIVDTSVRP